MQAVAAPLTAPPVPALAAAFAERGKALYLVGGPVRDTLLGREHAQDLDFTTDARPPEDRKSTRLNSSHANISYAVFCLKKKIIFTLHCFLTYMHRMRLSSIH